MFWTGVFLYKDGSLMETGRPTVYFKERHIPELLQFRKDGLSIPEMCANWSICEATYHAW